MNKLEKEGLEKLKSSKVLTKRQLEFMSYVFQLAPITVNELIDHVYKINPKIDPKKLVWMNKTPADLKKIGVLRVSRKRTCNSTGKKVEELVPTFLVPKNKLKVPSGKTKKILESSKNSALLAIEIYNKPRATFRSEAYISLMVIAWTKLMHAYFRNTQGDIYYERGSDGKFKIINGHRIAWNIRHCIARYPKFDKATKANIEFFIPLRDMIEHDHIESKEVDHLIFGQCQALLYNYEKFLVEHFGQSHAINENLVYSLQFSQIRENSQVLAWKKLQEPNLKDLHNYVLNFNKSLPMPVYNSQEYQVKVRLTPVVSNTVKCDLAVQFTKLAPGEAIEDNQLNAIIKDHVITKEVLHDSSLLAKEVVVNSNELLFDHISMYDHTCLLFVFGIKPFKTDLKNGKMKDKTKVKYCAYFEKVDRYFYTDEWVDFIVRLFNSKKMNLFEIREYYRKKERLDITKFE